MVRVKVRLTTKVPVRAIARDQKPISPDDVLASDLVQALGRTLRVGARVARAQIYAGLGSTGYEWRLCNLN